MQANRIFHVWQQRAAEIPPFALALDGEPVSDWLPRAAHTRSQSLQGDIRCVEDAYRLPFGLTITLYSKQYPGFDAADWVLTLQNDGTGDSPLVTGLLSCATVLPLPPDELAVPGWQPPAATTWLHWAKGSRCEADDFIPRKQPLWPGWPFRLAPVGGRSSDGVLPFFDVARQDEGVIVAVGWTGQWNASFTRVEEGVKVEVGMEDGCFRLHPGESVRTPSTVMLFYDGGQARGRNLLRRMIRTHFAPVGCPGRAEHGPLCLSSWGGVDSDRHIQRLRRVAEENLGFEMYWIDAGWYGDPAGDSPSEFVGDWYTQAGDWRPNTKIHPEGLAPVSRAAREAGMGLLLWFETERALAGTPVPSQHPDWFLSMPDSDSRLLDLGNPEALGYATELICGAAAELDLACYRQDFNFEPLGYWRAADEPDRKGIHEMKHIAGLYRLWDTLLARFPGILIDNCASGGRRIDIETIRRAMPLWRSDVQCVWDVDPEAAQCHNAGLHAWVPFHSTGAGCERGDIYRARSAYSTGLACNYWGYRDWDIHSDEPWDWICAMTREYKRVRPYMEGDYYPLTLPSADPAAWAAWQFDRPDLGGGIILAFRRTASPLTTGCFMLGGMAPGGRVRLTDADTGHTWEVSAEELARGLTLTLPKPRSSCLIYYQRLGE